MQVPFEFLGCMGCRQNLDELSSKFITGGYIEDDYVADYYRGY